MAIRFQRVLLKLSGEYLGGSQGAGFDYKTIESLVGQIHRVQQLGVEVAIVLGGGNFFRGAKSLPIKIDRTVGDQIGMLATLMNSMCLKEALLAKGVKARVMTGLAAPEVAGKFNKATAVNCLKNGEIMIFGGGTGNPYFSTDTAAVLRALEIEADVVIKGTKVDGVYDRDPMKDADAVKFEQLTYGEVLERDLKVMDGAAIALCRENTLPLCVLSIANPNDLTDFVVGKKVGTLVGK